MPAVQHQAARTDDELRVCRLVDIDVTQKALAEMHRDVAGLIRASRRRQIAAHNKPDERAPRELLYR